MFGWENLFLCQIPRFQPQYNVHEYQHWCFPSPERTRREDLEQFQTTESWALSSVISSFSLTHINSVLSSHLGNEGIFPALIYFLFSSCFSRWSLYFEICFITRGLKTLMLVQNGLSWVLLLKYSKESLFYLSKSMHLLMILIVYQGSIFRSENDIYPPPSENDIFPLSWHVVFRLPSWPFRLNSSLFCNYFTLLLPLF